MTAVEDARAALAQGELNAEMGVPVTWGEVKALHRVIEGLLKVTDEQVDAAQDAFHGFVFGFDAPPLSERDKGITRQAWRVALQAARAV